MIRLAMIAAFALFTSGLAGCAGPSTARMSDAEFREAIQQYNARVPKEEKVYCEKRAKVGTKLKRWECINKWSTDQGRVRTQEIIKKLKAPYPGGSN